MNYAAAAEASTIPPIMPDQRFVVEVRRDGQTLSSVVYAQDWFEAWDQAITMHGLDCRIEVRPEP